MVATRVQAEAEVSEWSDSQLVRAGSTGERDVFVELYRRHADVARRVARGVTGNDEDAADAAADAFTRVFDAVVSGRTPSMEFRAYLIAASRNAAIDQLRRSGRRASEHPDHSPVGDDRASGDVRTSGPGPSEALAASEDSKLVTDAFQGLPARWQSVLWLTEVEGVPAREAAGRLGLSPNNVAQLAVRARARLRERYLQAHVRNHAQPRCQTTVDHLGAYLAGTLAERRRARVDEHLSDCPACCDRLAEVEDLGVSLRRALVPIPLLALGWRRRGSRHHRMQPVSTTTALDSPGEGLTARVSVAASGSPLFRTLALMPVSAAAVVAGAGPAMRWVLRGAITVLTALSSLTGIGVVNHGPAAVSVAAPMQATIPPTTVAQPPPTPVAPAATGGGKTTDRGPLPVTAHPSSIVARSVGPTLDVFEPDHITIERSLVNLQPSGAPLVFLVVEQQPGWLRVLMPIRPNGSTGWLRRQDVSVTSHTFSLVVELAAHRITAFHGTEPFLSEPVGVGTTDTPTPPGLYYTRELIEKGSSGGPYGPYIFGLSGHSDVLTEFGGGDGELGIHGTNDPSALGHDVSHGCIRMSNAGITRLAEALPLGVPVEIRA